MKPPPDLPPAAFDALAALIDFPPVPVRARHDGWSVERQRHYVLALALTGHSGRATREVGMTPQSVCTLRRRPGAEGFAQACEHAYRHAARHRRAHAAARLMSAARPEVFDSRQAETSETHETSAEPFVKAPIARPPAPEVRR